MGSSPVHHGDGVLLQGTWTLIGVEAGLWMVYGVLLGDTPVMIFAAVGLVGAMLILARVWWTIGFRAPVVRSG